MNIEQLQKEVRNLNNRKQELEKQCRNLDMKCIMLSGKIEKYEFEVRKLRDEFNKESRLLRDAKKKKKAIDMNYREKDRKIQADIKLYERVKKEAHEAVEEARVLESVNSKKSIELKDKEVELKRLDAMLEKRSMDLDGRGRDLERREIEFSKEKAALSSEYKKICSEKDRLDKLIASNMEMKTKLKAKESLLSEEQRRCDELKKLFNSKIREIKKRSEEYAIAIVNLRAKENECDMKSKSLEAVKED